MAQALRSHSRRWLVVPSDQCLALGLQTGGFGPWSLFIRFEVWERWISINGGAGTAFPCVQWHFNHCFWRDVAVCLSFSNFFCDWPSVDPNLSTALYHQKDLCVFCRTYTSVESLTTKTAGPIKRPSSSTIASLNDIIGSVASSYKSHRLQLSATTKLCGFITWLQCVV